MWGFEPEEEQSALRPKVRKPFLSTLLVWHGSGVYLCHFCCIFCEQSELGIYVITANDTENNQVHKIKAISGFAAWGGPILTRCLTCAWSVRVRLMPTCLQLLCQGWNHQPYLLERNRVNMEDQMDTVRLSLCKQCSVFVITIIRNNCALLVYNIGNTGVMPLMMNQHCHGSNDKLPLGVFPLVVSAAWEWYLNIHIDSFIDLALETQQCDSDSCIHIVQGHVIADLGLSAIIWGHAPLSWKFTSLCLFRACLEAQCKHRSCKQSWRLVQNCRCGVSSTAKPNVASFED